MRLDDAADTIATLRAQLAEAKGKLDAWEQGRAEINAACEFVNQRYFTASAQLATIERIAQGLADAASAFLHEVDLAMDLDDPTSPLHPLTDQLEDALAALDKVKPPPASASPSARKGE